MAVLGVMVALAVVGIAQAAPSATAPVDSTEVAFSSGFAPKPLSKIRPSPISFHLSAQVTPISGGPPPELKNLVFEEDTNMTVSVEGIPVCRPILGIPIEERCQGTIVGRGSMSAEVALPESSPFLAKGDLTIFNRGREDGVTTLVAYTILRVPLLTAVISKIEIRKAHKDGFGTKVTVSFPIIAGGNASVTSFRMMLHKRFLYKGKRASFLTLKCQDGQVRARAKAIFGDGSTDTADFLHTCT